MRFTSVVFLALTVLPSAVAAQSARAPGQSSRVTTLIGVGNSFSGVGVLADFKPFARGPLSLVASVGSVSGYFGDASGSTVALALGVRANAGHGMHQGFAEFSLLPVDDDVVGDAFPSQISLLYGLGLQLGYRARLSQGITLNALAGGGYALTRNLAASPWKPLIGFGFGYAWPQH